MTSTGYEPTYTWSEVQKQIETAVKHDRKQRTWVGLTDDELYVKASAYANNRKKAYQEGMKAGRCPKKTEEELGWLWVAHVDGYREAYWMATDDTRYTTDSYKENT